MTRLNARAWLALAVLAAGMGLLLFGGAGTIRYWQARVYLSVFLGASLLTTLYPLALGSHWGFLVVAVMMLFLIWRLVDENRVLARDLPGYTEYQQRIRHRLAPLVLVSNA